MSEFDPNQTPPDSFHSINKTPGKKRPPADNLAVSSVAAGAAAIVVSCCSFPTGIMIGFALGMAGLVLAIVSKKGEPFSGYAIAGLILSVMGILTSLLVFFSYMFTAHMMSDPVYGPMIRDMFEQYQSQIEV